MIALSKPWDFSLMRNKKKQKKWKGYEPNKNWDDWGGSRLAKWIEIIGKFEQSQINFLKYYLISITKFYSPKQSQKK